MKAPTRKPPGNSTLKTLPPEVQEELFTLCNTGTQPAALKWLRDVHGIKVSDTTLSKFWRWYSATRLLVQGETVTQQIEEWLKTSAPGITPDQLADVGNQAFLALAMKDSNGKEFARFIKTLANIKNARANENRVKLLAEKLEDAKTAEPTAPTVDTVAELKKLFGRN